MKRNVDDILYERPAKQKVFVSSQMRGGVLVNERQAAAKAINETGFAFAWLWENDACTGPYSSEAICLGHARTSEGLVLILAKRLTPVTQKEYEEADNAGVPRYVFLKQGTRRDPQVNRFVKKIRAKATTTGNFNNLSELETQVKSALYRYAVDSVRKRILETKTTKRSIMRKTLENIKEIVGSSPREKS